MLVTMKITVFLDVMMCSIMEQELSPVLPLPIHIPLFPMFS